MELGSQLLSPLTEQPYWFRLWVVQELTLARKLTFRYKALHVDWIVLHACLEHVLPEAAQHLDLVTLAIRLSPSWKPITHEFRPELQALFLLRERKKNANKARLRKLALSEAVLVYADQECSVIHDRVFGLMGMTTATIEPDYNMDLLNVYVFVLIEGLLEIRGANDPTATAATRGQKSAAYTVGLAKALGQKLHRPYPHFVTAEILGYFGVRFAGVGKLWASQRLKSLWFTRAGNVGKSLHPKASALLHQIATIRLGIDRGSDYLAGWDSESDPWKAYVTAVGTTYRVVAKTRANDASALLELSGQLPSLIFMSPDEAESLVQRILSLRSESAVFELIVDAIRRINSELETMIGLSDDFMSQAKLYRIWELLLVGLTTRGLSSLYTRNMQQHLEAIRRSREHLDLLEILCLTSREMSTALQLEGWADIAESVDPPTVKNCRT